jgi:neurotransmitter:Na+ symporter, NSS family
MSVIREQWSSKFGFLFAAVGSAVGLGLLWKFPFTVKENGGGLFLLSYLICLLVVGVPVFIGELILGRSSRRAAVGAYQVLDKKKGSWRGVGWLGCLASFLIMSYYSSIGGWGISYILMSLQGFYQGLTVGEVGGVFTELSKSGGITVIWHFIFTGICLCVVISGVRQGIEYWSKIMMRILLVLLIALFCYCLGLSGLKEAAHFIFYPDPSRFKLSSMLEALGLAFFTMSLGQGVMISYGSYMKKDTSVVKMAAVVGFSVLVVAILASMIIFPVLFSFAVPPGEGMGLVFQTMPFLFGKLPASLLLSTSFFVLFVFAGITSAIPLIEVVATNLMELYKLTRKRAVVYVSIACFIFGIPSAFAFSGGVFPGWSDIYKSNFLRTMDALVSVWVIPVGGLLSSIFIGWVLDRKVAKSEFTAGGAPVWLYYVWRFFIRFVVPLVILAIIVEKSGIIGRK